MKYKNRTIGDIAGRTRKSVPVRFLFWTGIGIVVWIFSSKGVQDALIYAAFLFALFKASRGASAWRQPAGVAFIVVMAYTVATLPFSDAALISMREFGRFLKIAAGAFAIPVIFDTREKVKSALLYSAVAITAALTYDLARLRHHLGGELLARAHSFEPFILNHSNVSSMMAGASFFIFFYFFWSWRRRRPFAAACLVGMAVCLAYLVVMASRGPQIAFAITCGCAGFLIPGVRGKLAWLAGSAAVGYLLVTGIHAINPRFLEESTMSGFSDRDKVWSHTLELVSARPWFGYGYGKRNFVRVYYSTNPPEARFEFPHAHQFWLKILFESGAVGFLLHLAAWSILAAQILRRTFAGRSFQARLLPGTVGLILLLIHLYGLGDYPDNVVRMAQFWLVPVALVLTRKSPANQGGPGDIQ